MVAFHQKFQRKATMIAGIIQEKRERHAQVERRQFVKEFASRLALRLNEARFLA